MKCISSCTIYFLLLFLFTTVPASYAQETQCGVPVSRITRMRRGYNQQPIYGSNVTNDNLKNLKSRGYDHARIGILPSSIWDAGSTTPKSSGVSWMKEVAAKCKNAGLGCFLDIHTTGSKPLDIKYTTDFITFWGKLAKELSSTDPEYTFLEIINEPAPPTRAAQEWYDLLYPIVREMRKNAPEHTIVMNTSQCMLDDSWRGGDDGINWDQIDVLVETMEIPDDLDNVIVSPHYYRPMTFTHQGASHVWKFNQINNIKFPVDSSNCQIQINRNSDPQVQQNIKDYMRLWYESNHWFEKQMKRVAQWRMKNRNIYVRIGEFGAIGNAKESLGRENYFRNIVGAMTTYNIGWCNWCQDFRGRDSWMGMDSDLPEYDHLYEGPDLPKYSETSVLIDEMSVMKNNTLSSVPYSVFRGPGNSRTIIDLSGRKMDMMNSDIYRSAMTGGNNPVSIFTGGRHAHTAQRIYLGVSTQ
jgi:hypothetical protein